MSRHTNNTFLTFSNRLKIKIININVDSELTWRRMSLCIGMDPFYLNNLIDLKQELYLGIEVFTNAAKDILIDVVQYLFRRCVQSHLAVT